MRCYVYITYVTRKPPYIIKIFYFQFYSSNGTSMEISINKHQPVGGQLLKMSHSSNELSLDTICKQKEQILETKSESDLLKYSSSKTNNDIISNEIHEEQNKPKHDAKFLKELIEEFDKHANITPEKTEKEDLCDFTKIPQASTTIDENDIERELFAKLKEEEEYDNNVDDTRALEIIRENSEILEKLLNKKTTPCHPELLANPQKSNGGIQPAPIIPPNMTTQHPCKSIAQPIPKRRISQTSSNGSSSSNKSSNITLQSTPATKPITFNPFPSRSNRKPKEVGKKLGLYK